MLLNNKSNRRKARFVFTLNCEKHCESTSVISGKTGNELSHLLEKNCELIEKVIIKFGYFARLKNKLFIHI